MLRAVALSVALVALSVNVAGHASAQSRANPPRTSPGRGASPAPTPTPSPDRASELSDADEVAGGHFRLASELYAQGNFAEAAREFEESYRLSNRPQLLFNLYLAYRDAADVERSADSLRRYLELVPDAPNRPMLEARLATLDAEIAERRRQQEEAAAREEELRVEAAARANASTAVDDEGSPYAHRGARVASFALASAGGAMLVGSLVTGLLARSAHADLESACDASHVCDASERATADRGRTLARTTDALWISGAAVATTGVVLLVTAGRARSPRVDASAICTPRVCGASARLRF